MSELLPATIHANLGEFTGLSSEELEKAFLNRTPILGFYIREIHWNEQGLRIIVLVNMEMSITLHANGSYSVKRYKEWANTKVE